MLSLSNSVFRLSVSPRPCSSTVNADLRSTGDADTSVPARFLGSITLGPVKLAPSVRKIVRRPRLAVPSRDFFTNSLAVTLKLSPSSPASAIALR